MAAKKKPAAPKRVARDSGASVTLAYKGKETVFGVHLMNTKDAIDYVDQLSGKKEGEEQLMTVQRYLLLDGKFAFKSTSDVDDSIAGLDVILAYKKIVAVNRVAEFVSAIQEERQLLKK